MFKRVKCQLPNPADLCGLNDLAKRNKYLQFYGSNASQLQLQLGSAQGALKTTEAGVLGPEFLFAWSALYPRMEGSCQVPLGDYSRQSSLRTTGHSLSWDLRVSLGR